MTPRGAHWWDGQAHAGDGAPFHAIAAATGRPLDPEYRDATAVEVDAAAAAAGAASDDYAAVPAPSRAAFLRRIADNLQALGDDLLARAGTETALPPARLVGERARTLLQLRLFADLVEEGSWVDARIDRAEPTRQPVPKPDLRALSVPIGPIAVFGASNFPFAYSVAGGDTASALAAGCPVVVKAHPAHPGTSELVAQAVVAAAAACELPRGVFGLVHGQGHAVGARLVQHPAIAAVGFTGSAAGGRALCAVAAQRPVPIPVFAEMGSANPVFALPAALEVRGAAIAAAVAASALQAVGQFCTSPGLVVVPGGAAAERFVGHLATAFASAAPGTLVHPTVRAHFDGAVAEVADLPGVALLAIAGGEVACAATGARPRLFAAAAETVLAQRRLGDEIYGPALLVVTCRSAAEQLAVARALHGHLTATVHGTAEDLRDHGELLTALRRRVGRLVFDGVPTGVEVVSAMQHGGPWPASSDSRFTAVGPRAIRRWVRPLAFQDAPPAVLPSALRDGNPDGIWRTVDGVLGRH